MAERPPTTDFKGGDASEDPFTRFWMANLVVAYAVDFQSDFLSGVILESTVGPEDFGTLPWPLPGEDWI